MALHVLACICILLLRINRYYVSTANFWSYCMSARNTNCRQLDSESEIEDDEDNLEVANSCSLSKK